MPVIRTMVMKETADGEFTTIGKVAEAVFHRSGFEHRALTGQSLIFSCGWFME